jgi:predicted tellurium resistance membrane protein TerC
LLGGLFLIFKATREIMLLDAVFSLDSVVTAVGMVDEVTVMVVAMIVAVVAMRLAMEPLSAFVERHPSIKLLALAFLLLIGVMLVAEGMGQHVPKGCIYVAMVFWLFVELLNMRYRRRRAPLRLRRRYQEESASA